MGDRDVFGSLALCDSVGMGVSFRWLQNLSLDIVPQREPSASGFCDLQGCGLSDPTMGPATQAAISDLSDRPRIRRCKPPRCVRLSQIKTNKGKSRARVNCGIP